MKQSTPSASDVRSLVEYDESTGQFTWLKHRDAKRVGTIAGHIKGNGYRYIGVMGVEQLAHRLALLITTGTWPASEVDHRNGLRDDNRLTNLRVVSHSENNQNRGRQSNNTSGYIGVSYHRGNRMWSAQIKLHGKVTQLGYFHTPEAASDAYQQAKRRLHPAWVSGLGAA